ncbi:hypothetical protein B0H10DRAFT_1950772 [Mycena sp. CBHHK59/15]|nr:hypothetical protein B0H10DRAFT_1950772 [Mycena sp. CBHHK59/15]
MGGEGNTSGSGDERGEAELGARVWAMGGGVKERRRPRDETLTRGRRLSSTSSSSSSPSDPWWRSGMTLGAEKGWERGGERGACPWGPLHVRGLGSHSADQKHDRNDSGGHGKGIVPPPTDQKPIKILSETARTPMGLGNTKE